MNLNNELTIAQDNSLDLNRIQDLETQIANLNKRLLFFSDLNLYLTMDIIKFVASAAIFVQRARAKPQFPDAHRQSSKGYRVSLINSGDERIPNPPFILPTVVSALRSKHELHTNDIVIATYPKCGT